MALPFAAEKLLGRGIPAGTLRDEHGGMGRTRDMTADGMRIEYLKGRRALRMTAVEADGPGEVPLSALVDRLEIDRRDLGAQPRLLLFAGLHHDPRGGAGDLAGWYDGEDEALAAFREVRSTRSDYDGWAELVALDAGLRTSVRAWFGRPHAERRLRVVAGRGHHPATQSRHLRLLAR